MKAIHRPKGGASSDEAKNDEAKNDETWNDQS